MRNPPTGTVTFLFTDIEGSTHLAREHPEAWENARAQHDSILREAIEANGGYVFQIVGDSFCVAFHKAGEALKAAIKAQHDLQNQSWGDVMFRVRMGIHTGEAEVHEQEYHGYLTLSLVQRVMSAGHGGQMLLSNVTENLLQDSLPKDVSLRDMGEHKLKGVSQSVRLFQVIAPDLQSEFPALKTQDAHPSNLPVQLTDFIGREKELAEIAEAVAQNRLVTLIGAGGTGKTRLAIEAGTVQLSKDHFTNGVFFISLAPLESTESIVPTIASSLGFSFYGGGEPRQQLFDCLREKSMLLIMDNFEHLLSGVDLVTEILNTAPRIKILATSRARLNVQGEQLFHLTGMDFPNWESPQDAIEYSAVKLFTQTAHRVRSDFELTTDNIKYIVRLCRLVDGIPLGILLASSWMEMLAPDEIAGEIEKSLDFLETRQRDLPDRQHSMRAVFDYSWKLLTENEQNVLMKSSVFRGGFTREAAEQMTGASLRDLMGLVDKSFLQRDSYGRYQIHELLRQYAYEKLVKAGEEKNIRNRHRDWFLDSAEQAVPELRKETQLEWRERLEKELENLRASMRWTLEQEEAELALRLAGALCEILDDYREVQPYLEKSLALATGLEHLRQSKWRAKVLLSLGDLAVSQCDFSLADDAYQKMNEALDIYQKLDLKVEIADTLSRISYSLYFFLGDEEKMLSTINEAVMVARASGNHFQIARALNVLALCLPPQEHLRIKSLLEESLENLQIAGDRFLKTTALDNLAAWEIDLGNIVRAQTLIEEYLVIAQQIKYQLAISRGLRQYGRLSCEQGNYAKALGYYHESLSIARELNEKNEIENNLWYRGQLLIYKMDFEEAVEVCQEGLQISNGIKVYDAIFQVEKGYILLAKSSYAEALSLFSQYQNIPFDISYVQVFAKALMGLGDVARILGNQKEALNYYQQAIKHVQEVGQAFTLEYLLEGAAKTLCEMNETEKAVRLFGAATSIRKKWNGVIHPVFREEYDKYIKLLREELGDTTFENLWLGGASLSIDEAIALAV